MVCAETSPESLGRATIYSIHGKEAFAETFRLSNGSLVEYFLFGSKEKPIIIFPLTDKNEVIAIEQFRYGANTWILELPGGVMGEGETKIETAKRELVEETGYECNSVRQIASGIWFDPASVRISYDIVLMLGCQKNSTCALDKEELIGQIRVIPIKEWLRMIENMEIRDSKSIVATMLVLPSIKELICV